MTATVLIVLAVALSLLPNFAGTPAVNEDNPSPEPTPDPGSVNPDVTPDPVPAPTEATTFDEILADLEAKRAAFVKANAELSASTVVVVDSLKRHGGPVFRGDGDGGIVVYSFSERDGLVTTRPSPPSTPVPAA